MDVAAEQIADRGGGQPLPGAALGHQQQLRAVEVDAEAAAAFGESGRVAIRVGQQIGDQLAADPVLGLGDRAPQQQEQAGDHRGPFEQPPVGVVELSAPVQDQSGQEFPPGEDRADPAAVAVHGTGAGTGLLGGLGQPPGVHAVGGEGRAVGPDGRQRASARVVDGERGVQQPRDRRRDVLDVPAAQYQVGQPVVGLLGPPHGRRVGPYRRVGLGQLGVGARQFVQCGAGVGERAGGVDGDRGVCGERAEQRDLVGAEDAGRAVGGEEDADDLSGAAAAGAEEQRHAQDGDEPLVQHSGVDVAGVVEAVVGAVVVGRVRACGLRHQPAQPVAELQPQPLEEHRHRSVGDPHVGVPRLLVGEGEICRVRTEQHPGPADDRLQHLVQVAGGGQVARGVEERGELEFAAAVLAQRAPDPQGGGGGPLHLRQIARGHPGGTGLRGDGAQRLGGGVVGQQVEQAAQMGAAEAGGSDMGGRYSSGAGGQLAVQPPSMESEVPVMCPVPGPQSHSTAPATSSGSISRLIALRSSMTRPTTSSSEMPCVRAWSAIWFSTRGCVRSRG